MRDYSKVSGQFWTGKTGKALRGNQQAQIIALYLLTSPHANMIGVFHCPILYMAHETGSPIEGATKGLQTLCEGGFCTYDDDTETVWVHEMAKFQIDEQLKPGDNRVKAIQKQYVAMPEGRIKSGFFEKYAASFHLPKPSKNTKPLASPLQAPPKPEAGTGVGAEGKPPNSSSLRSEELPPPGKKRTFNTWLAEIKASGEKAVSDYKPVWEYAERVGISPEWIEIAWIRFRERYGSDPNHKAKRYIDWRRVFLNAVEQNWFGLWYAKDGEFQLSTVGQQADLATREAA